MTSVLIERRESTLLITIDRPTVKNALDLEVAEGIATALDSRDAPPTPTERCAPKTWRSRSSASRCDVGGGAGLPVPHSHDAFEETIYGLEGVTTFQVDGDAVPVGPGDTLCIRRGQVHSFIAEGGDVSFLAIATPGVFGSAYFLELAEVLAAADGPPDPQAIGAVMLRHGLTPVPAAG
ncbi:MAG: cupin domain-containing protein [Solirubrobacterales bacterium]